MNSCGPRLKGESGRTSSRELISCSLFRKPIMSLLSIDAPITRTYSTEFCLTGRKAFAKLYVRAKQTRMKTKPTPIFSVCQALGSPHLKLPFAEALPYYDSRKLKKTDQVPLP